MNETAERVDAALLEKWRPFRGPFVRWPRTADAALALFAIVVTMLFWAGEQAEDDPSLPFGAFAVFVAGNASLYWRRRHPERVHAVILAASVLAIVLGYLHGPIFALVISLYNLGRYTVDNRNSVIGLVAACALLLTRDLAAAGLASVDPAETLLAFVFWYTGKRVRRRGEYLRLLKERADQLEREQLAEAEKALAAERARIARELHDVVAHQVSLMTVQAGAAKTVIDADPAAAAKAMLSVEVAGRQALDELRHLLDVLRPGGENCGLGPQPGRADLPRLVEELGRAGLHVSLRLDDDGKRLPARIDLAIYRIVQEALTNVLKHAGPRARAEVRVRAGEREVSIEVRDDGAGGTRLPGSGYGIAGMRERAQSLAGTLTAGPREGGGFAVTARLPAREETA